MRLYRLYGITMASDYPFVNPLPPGSAPPDVSFSCTTAAPRPAGETGETLYASRNRTDRGSSIVSVQRTDDCHVFRFAESIDFYLFPDRIIAHLRDPAFRFLVEILLLGEIFSLWLELRGIVAVHASAVVIGNKTTAFLSTNKGGKTGLAAALAQKGHPILTDDILAVGNRDGCVLAWPGYPALRMWPDQAGFFLGSSEDLEIVHPWYEKRRIPVGPMGFGTFCAEEKSLSVIYVPRRLGPEGGITIEPLGRKAAFFALIHNTFSAGIVEALGLQSQRMDFFSRLLRQVPVRRLSYPEGFSLLSDVADAVIEDSESGGNEPLRNCS